ncbi:hypothetical protein GPNCGGLF_LOCUS2098 [Methylorubrum aminovorans]
MIRQDVRTAIIFLVRSSGLLGCNFGLNCFLKKVYYAELVRMLFLQNHRDDHRVFHHDFPRSLPASLPLAVMPGKVPPVFDNLAKAPLDVQAQDDGRADASFVSDEIPLQVRENIFAYAMEARQVIRENFDVVHRRVFTEDVEKFTNLLFVHDLSPRWSVPCYVGWH